ncbi:multi-sensor signal transduction histidine kinase [Halorubrum coriense DSM 10284]|uniref:histidine kinase n=1 Tax=Halorubrum coriense DSM 10284 TaxID=1227466 RepID=M0E947_9EURY|nr:HAMP domain-containing sensor histidine kinase [Halorubrum coriense]ELZ44295.1 multi-sensor signal transduction histidine kinase [Halorubrum coriense DSM 10284]
MADRRQPDATLTVAGDESFVADETAVRSVLENLFRNAAVHAGTDPAVAAVALDGGFAVVDDGPGVPPAERDRVFDRGYTTADAGTGIGLASVATLAASHGWTVGVGPGRGTAEGEARASATAVGDGAAFVVAFGDRPAEAVASPVIADADALVTVSEPPAPES